MESAISSQAFTVALQNRTLKVQGATVRAKKPWKVGIRPEKPYHHRDEESSIGLQDSVF
jgi:hypothetical protein